MKGSPPVSMPRRSSSVCSTDSRHRGSISETGLPPDVVTGGVAVDQLLRRSRWPVLRRLGFHPGGDERSSLRGAGLEYSDVREYQAGDDPRTIEWNITARSDRPYVRESLPDRGLDAWLLVDITRSLDWGTARCLKRQLAIEFSAVVGQLLIGRGNRVGALLFDDRVRSIIPPSAGRTALLQLIARMERTAGGQEFPSPSGGGQGGGVTDLSRALTEGAGRGGGGGGLRACNRPEPGADGGGPAYPPPFDDGSHQRFHDAWWLAETAERAGDPPRGRRRLDHGSTRG